MHNSHLVLNQLNNNLQDNFGGHFKYANSQHQHYAREPYTIIKLTHHMLKLSMTYNPKNTNLPKTGIRKNSNVSTSIM